MTPYYQDEATTIYHGDCREILPTLGRFDLLLTDPPYGIAMDKGFGAGGTDSSGKYARKPSEWGDDWDQERPLRAIACALGACDNAIVWGGNYFTDVLPVSTKWLYWDKLNSMPSYSDGELAWTTLEGVSLKSFKRCSNGNASRDGGKRLHPTQKPISLLRWCLSLVQDAQSILDPFMGSGTTLVAAKLEGRKAVGIEISEKYCESAAKRLEQGVLF